MNRLFARLGTFMGSKLYLWPDCKKDGAFEWKASRKRFD
jgi:hypothetical protein